MGIVDLGFISLCRPTLFLELGVEKNARIRARCGQDLHLEFEVLEIMVCDRTGVVEMGPGSMSYDQTVFNTEGLPVLTGRPALQALTITE